MNTICYFRTHFDDAANVGVVEKCRAISRAFGPETQAWFFGQSGLCLDHTDNPALPFPAPKHSWKHAYLYYFLSDRFLANAVDFKQFEIFYIRHLPAHPGFLQLLKKARQQNPALKIVLEIPTWPYDQERTKPWNMVSLLDKMYRKHLANWVDFIVHFGRETSIWGIPALPLTNGIDLASAPMRHYQPGPDGVFRLLAVGNWTYWQGLDRVLEGMHNTAFPKVQLTVVGDGPALGELKNQVQRWGLDQQVRFTGPLRGPSLDKLFDQADAAVGVLGLHRKGLSVASPLKHREYCLRGIPFVMAGEDADIPANLSWVFHTNSDDSPVPIDELWAWSRQLPPTTGLRDFAHQTLGWESRVAAIRHYSGRFSKNTKPFLR